MYTDVPKFSALKEKMEVLTLLSREFAERGTVGLEFALALNAIKLDLEKVQKMTEGPSDHETVN